MAWDGFLLPASFRGIPFFVDDHEKTGGRNAISHEPPDRDSSFAEDMGKRSDGYRIRGHILGDAYFFIRDALITAMEDRENGILIHPYLGLIDVQPTGYTLSEDTQEGRICRFELNFVEAGNPNAFFAALDLVTGFVTSVVSAVLQVQNAFAVAATFSGLPGYVIDSAVALGEEFIDTVNKALATIQANGEALAGLQKDIDDFDPALVVSDPVQFASDVDNICKGMSPVVSTENEDTSTINFESDQAEQVSVYDPLLAFGEIIEGPFLTSTQEAEANNLNAIVNLVNQTALIYASEAAANQTYFSEQAAVAQLAQLNDLLDTQLNVADIDDNLFQALLDQKAANVTMIPDPRKESGTTEDLEILETTPSLVLVYDEYGDTAREVDVLDRNRIENPAFIDGTIQVVRFG